MKKIFLGILYPLLAIPGLFGLASCGEKVDSAATSYGEVEAELVNYKDFSLSYYPEKGGYLVGDYRGSATEIIIPDEATGEDGVTAPVVGVNDYAFFRRQDLKTVVLGNNIVSIGKYAFAESGVTNLRISRRLLSIDDHSFADSSLTFLAKNNIAYLSTQDNPYFMAVYSGGIWTTSESKYKSAEDKYSGLLESSCRFIIVPNGLDFISGYAFAECTSCTVFVPGSVNGVGDRAFHNRYQDKNKRWWDSYCGFVFTGSIEQWLCTYPCDAGGLDESSNKHLYLNASLNETTDVVIPNSITSIPDYAFYRFTNIKSFTLSDNLTKIGDYAFTMSNDVVNNVEDLNLFEDEELFYLPSHSNPHCLLQRVGDRKLESYSIHPDCQHIGPLAFRSCSSMKELVGSESLRSVGSRAFYGCSSLTSADFQSDLYHVGKEAFLGCVSLESAHMVTKEVGDSVFKDCKSLKGLVVSGDSASGFCGQVAGSITWARVVEGTEALRSEFFRGCSSLNSVTLPSTLKKIWDRAFYNCKSLTSVVIPASVEYMGDYVFWGSGMKTIYCEAPKEPSGWYRNEFHSWDESLPSGCKVVWGYKG